MKPLAQQKQLLILESELNRAQLAQEWGAVTAEARALTSRAKIISSLVSATATLVAGVASCRHPKSAATEKPSWLKTLLKGAGMLYNFWQASRPPDGGQKDQ
jgi:hypothetical protein